MKLKYYAKLDLFRTVYFNYRFLPLKQAWKLPVVIFRKTRFISLKGKVELPEKVRHAMIKIGRADVAGWHGRQTELSIDGKLIFHGKATIGSGSAISISKSGTLSFGDKLRITAGCMINCRKSVVLGDDCLISWDTLIMDCDHHEINDAAGKRLNDDKAVLIGSHVWLGCRAALLKGVRIADGSVVAAGSILTGDFHETPNAVIGGSTSAQKILRQDICWKE